MKKLIRFLELIPSWLPQLGKRHILPTPVVDYSYQDMVFYTSTLTLWFGVGVVMLYLHSQLLGLFYLLLGISSYGVYVFLTCPKCPYYKKRCYMFGGQLAGRCFPYRAGDYTPFEDLVVPLLWIITTSFPIPFLVLYNAWASLLIYLFLAAFWQIMHKRNICVKCRNVRCALNPRYTGRNASS